MMNKPKIGVIPLYDEKKESYWMLPGYMKGIEASGGIPVMLPLTTDQEMIFSLAEMFDGFLFTGGQDVNPKLYGEEKGSLCGSSCDERDWMEDVLFHQVLVLDKPVLGICRGIQLLNVLLGGTLYQDIPSELPSQKEIIHQQTPPYEEPVHLVNINRKSLLYAILQAESLMVNSYHHQGIKQLADSLVSAATSEDGLTEAVYMPGKRFVYAVQWHPEYLYPVDHANFNLFRAFVHSCTGSIQDTDLVHSHQSRS